MYIHTSLRTHRFPRDRFDGSLFDDQQHGVIKGEMKAWFARRQWKD